MGDTKISWTMGDDGALGKTWNPIRGCSRISAGCMHCYAERMAGRFSGPGMPYEGLATIRTGVNHTARWTGEVRLVAEHLADPLRWRKPRRIFVNSMSDLFHESLTNEQIAAVFGVMAAAPQHTFQVLTKRARRMREWFAWVDQSIARHWHGQWGVLFEHLQVVLGDEATDAAWQRAISREPVPTNLGDAGCHAWPLPNVWLGVSAEDQAAADERIPELLATPAAVRFLSCEPLIGPVNLRRVRPVPMPIDSLTGSWGVSSNDDAHYKQSPRIDWVIAGCESGPGARPCSVEWLRSLRDQCATAEVAFFLKQARGVPEAIPAPDHADASAVTTCTTSGARWMDIVVDGDGSKRKAGGVIELPYLDGVQHVAFPEVPRG